MKITFSAGTQSYDQKVTIDLAAENCHEAALLALVGRHGYTLESIWASETAGTAEPFTTHLTLSLNQPAPKST